MKELAPYLPPGVESALGRFIANFALLEEHLRGIICEILKSDAPAGEIITAELSFRGLVSCFGALVKAYVSDLAIHEEADDLLTRVQRMNEFRNQVVHSLWVPDKTSPLFALRQKLASSKKVGFSPQIQRFRKRDLVSRCDEVAELTFEIAKLYEKISSPTSLYRQTHKTKIRLDTQN